MVVLRLMGQRQSSLLYACYNQTAQEIGVLIQLPFGYSYQQDLLFLNEPAKLYIAAFLRENGRIRGSPSIGLTLFKWAPPS